jgi:hypothetical protein
LPRLPPALLTQTGIGQLEIPQCSRSCRYPLACYSLMGLAAPKPDP